VARAADECGKALAAGGAGRDRARILVRWLACLVGPGAVTGDSAAQLLEGLLKAAGAAATEGASRLRRRDGWGRQAGTWASALHQVWH
jgi:hypothetical protein